MTLDSRTGGTLLQSRIIDRAPDSADDSELAESHCYSALYCVRIQKRMFSGKVSDKALHVAVRCTALHGCTCQIGGEANNSESENEYDYAGVSMENCPGISTIVLDLLTDLELRSIMKHRGQMGIS